MKTRLIIVGVSIFFVTLYIGGQEDGKKAQQERTYTQKEFNEEIDKRLQKDIEDVMRKIRPRNIAKFSQQLLNKEETLRVRELEVSKREEQLGILSKELEGKVREFKGRQEKFLLCAEEVGKKEDERVKHMVDVVGGMRPQNAADVLSVQETELAVKIMAILSSEKVSKIFNLMDKEISARLQKHYMTMKK